MDLTYQFAVLPTSKLRTLIPAYRALKCQNSSSHPEIVPGRPEKLLKTPSNDNAEMAAQPLDYCRAPCLEGLNSPSTLQGVKGTFRPGQEFA